MALRPADQIARVHTAVDITVLGALQFTTVQTVTTVLSDSPEQLIRLAWPATATPLRCSVRLEEYTGETNEAAGDPNSLFSSWAWSSPAALRASAAGQPLLLGAIPIGTNIVIEADFVTHIPTDGPARGAPCACRTQTQLFCTHAGKSRKSRARRTTWSTRAAAGPGTSWPPRPRSRCSF